MKDTHEGLPKIGISVYSYSDVLGISMTLDDVFEDMYDAGAECFELLTSHIENYPNPSVEWIDHYWRLCEKYDMVPAELGHWAETHLHRGPRMTDKEILDNMIRDFKLANTLGFTTLRTKITCINEFCDPEPEWRHIIEMALPYAEKYNVMMLSECHLPTTLSRQHIKDYIDFAKEMNTRYFGINVDFSTFQNAWPEDIYDPGLLAALKADGYTDIHSEPEEIIPILPYCGTCHAKFNYMDEDFRERTIPYDRILGIMAEQGWNGFLVSEYEGMRREDPVYLGEQMRRHHIMMRRILGKDIQQT